jgi:hypothetical protein
MGGCWVGVVAGTGRDEGAGRAYAAVDALRLLNKSC